MSVAKDTKKIRPKWMHWLARICTTFGLALATWLYLYWTGILGGVFFLGLLCALTALEVSRVTHPDMPHYRRIMMTAVSFFLPLLFHHQLQSAPLPSYGQIALEFFLACYIIIILMGIVSPRVIETVSKSMLFPIWGITLPLCSLIFVAHLIMDRGGSSTTALLWVISLIFIIKATDIGALLWGSWLGKHKLAPTISPGKTIEGAVGGVFTALLVAFVILFFAKPSALPGLNSLSGWFVTLAGVALISVGGVLGDLFESSWKRFYQMKNSGGSLPGLGGVFDLTDSMILASPVSYLLIKYGTLF